MINDSNPWREYRQVQAEERRWMVQSGKLHNLPCELAELAFCSECHTDADYSVQGEERDYETNSGGYGYASECCGADVYQTRYRLDLSPGRVKYIYPDNALIEYDGSEDYWEYCYDHHDYDE